MRHIKMVINYTREHNYKCSVLTALTGAQLVPERIKLDIINDLNAVPYVSASV